jgi:hypothetical protein
VQVVGHVSDPKCRSLLGPWVEGRPAAPGELRHLETDGDRVAYRAGAPASLRAREGEARLVLIDGGLARAAVERVDLLPIPAPLLEA